MFWFCFLSSHGKYVMVGFAYDLYNRDPDSKEFITKKLQSIDLKSLVIDTRERKSKPYQYIS